MTKQSPRIYVYKITFLEVLHYYYGVHLEKKFNEYYMGSPVTNKDFWEFYTPMKEIIKEFPFTDEGWLEALKFEKNLIKPVYNTDPLCLNESCGGNFSLEVRRRVGQKNKKDGVGIFSLTEEQMTANGKKGGSKGGPRAYELGVGIHALTFEQRSENSKKIGNKHKENGTGVCGVPKEKLQEIGRNSSQRLNAQVWECTITGHKSTPGGLSKYQSARGIDTSNRIRIQ